MLSFISESAFRCRVNNSIWIFSICCTKINKKYWSTRLTQKWQLFYTCILMDNFVTSYWSVLTNRSFLPSLVYSAGKSSSDNISVNLTQPYHIYIVLIALSTTQYRCFCSVRNRDAYLYSERQGVYYAKWRSNKCLEKIWQHMGGVEIMPYQM